MKTSYEFKRFCLVLLAGLLIFPLAGCGGSSGSSAGIPTSQPGGYPIDSNVVTTAVRTISYTPPPITPGLQPTELSQISKYSQYGYGNWTFGGPLAVEKRYDIMPPGYVYPSGPVKAQLLNFFAMTDIHITDKESPSQLIYLQQLDTQDAAATSAYSPVMLYTTQVLDAAVQTINALHKMKPFDLGISLGDTCNNTQYNELRWYIDVMDGKVITPSSGAHLGEAAIDYQKPYKAAGLDKTIPWYQTLGNHDHFWLGSFPVNISLRQSCISDTIFAAGDILANIASINSPDYYMGVLDGSTPTGDITGAGPVVNFNNPPKVVPDPNRRSLLRAEWISEFFNTTSSPIGHGLNLVDPGQGNGFACYSFVPKSNIPLKIIVLDDTQIETDGSPDIHGHGFLDQTRWNWLKAELASGDAAGQLMIVAAHIPIGVEPLNSKTEWWVNPNPGPTSPQNAVNLWGLVTELQSHPNLLMWLAGHRHLNTVKAFPGPTPEQGFWQVETSSLRDFPQNFRTFEIYLNSDYTISIVTTDVDPAVKEGTPAYTSRRYAVAALQIVDSESIYQKNATLIDLITQMKTTVPDTSIKPMFPTGSYNAELFKQLSSEMVNKLRTLYPTP
jgi:metallophosphoesterase (TIGR03768 family)